MLDIPLEKGQPTKYTAKLDNGDEFVFNRVSDDTNKFEDGEGKVYIIDWDADTGERVLYGPLTELTRRDTLKGIAKVLAVLEDTE